MKNNIAYTSDRSFISVLLTTFTTIFIAEIGDKTQVATLLLSAESGRPLYVFIGASIALILSSLIGVLVGKWLSAKVSPDVFNISAGTIMIVIALVLFVQIILNNSFFVYSLF